MLRSIRILALTLFTVLVAPLHAQVPAQQPATETRGQPNFARWENAVQKIEQTSKREPGGIVFTGSSSIARWTTMAEDFPGLPVHNHGFGGSIISEVTHFSDRLVIAYKPRMVLFYAGDNDLGFGHTPEQVLADFQEFVKTVRKGLPQARIAF